MKRNLKYSDLCCDCEGYQNAVHFWFKKKSYIILLSLQIKKVEFTTNSENVIS